MTKNLELQGKCISERKGTKRALYGAPMTWNEPKKQFDDCYFCSVNIKGMIRNKKR